MFLLTTDIKDLLACLSSTEVQQMLDELASDPDDKHVPASVRNAYKCSKKPTGPLDHTGLISYIKQESLASPDKEEEVPFEAGLKRGKVRVLLWVAKAVIKCYQSRFMFLF